MSGGEAMKKAGYSIRTKIILMVGVTLVVTQIVSAYLIRQLVAEHILSQKMTTVDILTTSVLHDLTYPLADDQQRDDQQIIAKYMTYYRVITDMTIYDQDGVAQASAKLERLHVKSSDPEVLAAVVRAEPNTHVSRPDFRDLGIRSVAPIFRGSRIVGAVAIDISMSDVQHTLAAMTARIAMIMGVKLLLVAIALYFMIRGTILSRLERLMGVTRQVIAGNYDIEVHDHRRDEIGQLASAFDQMTSDLLKSKKEIEDYNRHLEDRVREATAELQKAYEELKNAQGQLVQNEKMASLGVLISGIAHEINTPVGAILNISRNLEKQVTSLPQELGSLTHDSEVPIESLVACLQELIAAGSRPAESTSYRTERAVEKALEQNGVKRAPGKAAALCKLNFTDPERITAHAACFKIDPFFRFAESIASIAQAARVSQASSQKIAEIVRALKFYAYSDKDRTEMIQINESIETALVLLRNHLKHTVKVVTELDPDLPAIPCSSEISQVWTNLVTNACDAIAERGPGKDDKILIQSRRSADNVVVRVADNGSGIPPDKLDRIFDPFFTTKDFGKGTGLGLSVVSGIIKKHNGTIRVESVPGYTVFEIRLPLATASRNEDAGAKTREPADGETPAEKPSADQAKAA